MKYGILTLQYQPKINNIEKNLRTVERLISENKYKKLDLIVLPEFFSTGISHKGFIKYAENEKEPYILNRLSETAKKYFSNIAAGSLIEKNDGKFYNTCFVFDRYGNIKGKYRKIHLFSYFGGHEEKVITKGTTPVVIELDFARIGLAVCFDIRFPLHFNKLAKNGAEILVCPNAWCIPANSTEKAVKIKQEEIKAFAVARASENLCYFIGSSFCKKIGSGLISCANSIIVSPEGEVLSLSNGEECAIYSEINLDAVRKYRKEYSDCLIE